MALTRICPIFSDRTLAPRQRILEGLEKVEDAPPDDDVIVEPHETAHLKRQREHR